MLSKLIIFFVNSYFLFLKCKIYQAQQLVGSTILVLDEDRPELEEGDFYARDLVGMKVTLKVYISLQITIITAIEQIDIPRLLSQQGGETVYPLPRIRSLEVHPKLNLAALMFAVKSCVLLI